VEEKEDPMSLNQIRKELKKYSSKKHAKALQWFFKTGPGQYGEGDIFIGVKAAHIRATSKKYRDSSLKDTIRLLKSKIHEERTTALLILVLKYAKSDKINQKKIYDLYLSHTKYINNWDLVDLTAEHIVGAFLMDKSKRPLYCLVKSKMLWERRISILSTFHFIRNNKFGDTLKIAKILMNDKEDLIHKAVGWLLREIGKRDLATEESFLKKHYKKMPRTMLRYAIEKFPESKRQAYLKGGIK